MVLGRPFTLDYARAHTDPALWSNPRFIRTNLVVTSVWGLVFSLNAVLAAGKMERLVLPDWGYEGLSYALLVAAALFTSRYPAHVRRTHQTG